MAVPASDLPRTALAVYRCRAESAEADAAALRRENALLRRSLSLLVRSLEDRDPEMPEQDRHGQPPRAVLP